MADALAPWLLDYVLSVAETYGADLSNVRSRTKGKKVQITEFLTYNSEAEDSLLWAGISDKQYVIPVKFTSNAVADTTSKRFTQHKTAVIIIKNFKLIFTRVPLGTLGKMTSQPSLAIECLWFSVLGSSGEAIFGNPKPITDHPDLHSWSECLKCDGGAGNILKDRRVLNDSAGRSRSPVFKLNIYQPRPCAPVNASITSYMNKWQFVERTQGYRHLPQAISAPPDGTACTFLNEPASDLENGGAPNAQHGPLYIPPEAPLTEPKPSNDTFSFSNSAPTPAQRMNTSKSYLGHGSRNSGPLMAESAVRKIPRPPSPEPHDHTHPIRILAPNSDTSSQPQFISQTHSQSRRLSGHVQAGSTIDYEDPQALLLGIMVDLEGGEYPSLNLLQVREILEKTQRLR